MGRTRDVSKILTSNTSILTLASASTTYQTKASNALVLLNTTSFTTQSTVSINDVFSATYTNYRILLKASQSAAEWLSMRMRVSDADATTSAYNFVGLRGNTTDSFSGTATMGYISHHTTGNVNKRMSIDVFNPFNAANTFVVSTGLTVTPTVGLMSWEHQVATSYTGFTLLSLSGATITGEVSVYGYNK
jgi:hypothetical protein